MDNIHIKDSYLIKKERLMVRKLNQLKQIMPESKVWNRSLKSLIFEWKTHNLLYELHLFRSHTTDVDLEETPPIWQLIIFYICGFIFWHIDV